MSVDRRRRSGEGRDALDSFKLQAFKCQVPAMDVRGESRARGSIKGIQRVTKADPDRADAGRSVASGPGSVPVTRERCAAWPQTLTGSPFF